MAAASVTRTASSAKERSRGFSWAGGRVSVIGFILARSGFQGHSATRREAPGPQDSMGIMQGRDRTLSEAPMAFKARSTEDWADSWVIMTMDTGAPGARTRWIMLSMETLSSASFPAMKAR